MHCNYLPLPYSRTDSANCLIKPSEEFNKKILQWAEKATIVPMEKEINILSSIGILPDDEVTKYIYDHLDRFKYFNDFSSVACGLCLCRILDDGWKDVDDYYIITFEPVILPRKWSESERRFITLKYSEIQDPPYPEFFYDYELRKKMDILDWLEWMNNNCKFIPFRWRAEWK